MSLSGCGGTTVIILDESGRKLYEPPYDISDEKQDELTDDLLMVLSMIDYETEDEKAREMAIARLQGMSVEEIHEKAQQFRAHLGLPDKSQPDE